MDELPFEEVEHTADWALRASGAGLADLMVNSARGMLSLMQVEPGPGLRRRENLSLQAADAADLLVRWLEELLFRIETRGVAFTDIRVALPSPGQLEADLEVAPLASIGHAIKAVTFHGLNIEPTAGGCQATVVFDV